MKRYLIAFFLIVLCTVALGFGWKPQSNEALRGDMLTFAEGFAQRAKGTPAGEVLDEFVKEQKQNTDDPYAWISATKDVVLKLEALCPPVFDDGSPEAWIRRDIFRLMDFPIHVDNRNPDAPEALKTAFRNMSEEYRGQARDKALAYLDEPGPKKSGVLQVIKVYNCGIILRDSRRTIAVDIKWEGDAAGAEAIASKTDAFYLSHPHSDHYSYNMIEAFCKEGVTSVLPSDVAAKLDWPGKTVIHEDIYRPMDVNGIKTVIQAGDQKKAPNNLYLLEFDGWRVLLPGESDDLSRLSELARFYAPDLIITPSWNRLDLVFRAVSKMKGFGKTKVVFIPEHENEFVHAVDHRESYRELFTRADRLGGDDTAVRPKVMLLEIGECATLTK